jgi:hypothetical protein
MRRIRELLVAIGGAAILSGWGNASAAQGSRAGAIGNDWYSEAQAAKGKALFAQKLRGLPWR